MPERHVFISYSRKDTDMMQRVKQSLEANGIPYWTDEGIKPGTPSWKRAIQSALDSSRCGCMIILMSPHAKGSEWVQREIDYAETQSVHIFPLLIRGNDASSIPFALIGAQYVDMREDYEVGINRLLPEVARVLDVDLPKVQTRTIGSTSKPPTNEQIPPTTSYPRFPEENSEPEEILHIKVISEPEPLTPNPEEIAEQPETPYLEEAVIDGSIEPVTRNDDWEPVIREINGIEMVLVPPGCFMMGSEDGDESEKPVHKRCVTRPFWIGRYTVTNVQYAEAVRDNICDALRYADDRRFNDPQQPVVGVNWHNAKRYATWKQMRLPTETEWEYAARGPRSWQWPWGNDFDVQNLVYSKNSGDKSAVVGSRSGGASWVGALDLSGNVWEWCLGAWRDDYGSEEDNQIDRTNIRVLRGGSWNYDRYVARAASRYRGYPDVRYDFVSFRLVCMASIAE